MQISMMPLTRHNYLSWVEMLVKLVLSEVPNPFTTAMIPTAIPAAIRPYSMAVAPDSFLRKAANVDIPRPFLAKTLFIEDLILVRCLIL